MSSGLILLDRVLRGAEGFGTLIEPRQIDERVKVIITSFDNPSGDVTKARS